MVELSDLTIFYGDQPAVRELTLSVPAGECLLLTGPSGCGKSTVVKAIGGLIPHAVPAAMEGRIVVAGMDTRQQSVAELATEVGTVFQNPGSQLFHLRVDDEVAFGLRNLGLSEELVPDRVDWALQAVGLQDCADQKPIELSGGQQQRLAIACALAMQPSVLVLDEPTASLDVGGTKQVMACLARLKENLGLTIVLMEHRLAEAIQLADRAAVMDQGGLVAEGQPATVLADRTMMRQLGLRRPADMPPSNWSRLVVPNGHEEAVSDPLLRLQGVSAGYNGHPVLKDIDVTLQAGEFTALVGENGAGKSTLGLVAAGLLKPSQGSVTYASGAPRRSGRQVSMLFQNPMDQLLTDQVDMEVALSPQNFECFDECDHQETLAKTGLLDLRWRRSTILSTGQQQRVALAACLASRPRLLILDEPTLGQDWGHLEQLMDFVVSLNSQGVSILLITHDYKLVHRYARRVLVMEGGRIVLDGHLENHVAGAAHG